MTPFKTLRVGAWDSCKINLYNCNGLGNRDKMRRLFTKARSEVNKGGIILLRETHIVDETLIKMYWNMNYVPSCVSTQSAGVLTLYLLRVREEVVENVFIKV